MRILEKLAKKIPNRVIRLLKKPLMIGTHHLMFSISPVRTRLQPRKFQLFCLGLPRTGTASIAGLFQARYRARHEPEDIYTTEKIIDYIKGHINERQMISFIKKRDKCLWLEVESSHFLYFFIDILLNEFEDAKFILLIRDCYSWLNSYINHQLGRPLSIKSTFWKKLRDIYFDNKFEYSEKEQILSEHGLYTIDGYLSRWKTYNEEILSLVPKGRLMIIRTFEIDRSIENIEKFLDIPINSLDRSKSHFNECLKKFDFLSKIDKKFLKKKFDFYCKDLMKTYYPELFKIDYGIRKD